MLRFQQRWEVVYGHFGEFMQSLDEVNAVLRQRGWVEFTLWVPLSGRANEVLLVSDYPDMDTYKKEEAAAYGDPEFMKVWRLGSQHVVQGSGTSELLEPAPQMA